MILRNWPWLSMFESCLIFCFKRLKFIKQHLLEKNMSTVLITGTNRGIGLEFTKQY